MCDTGHSSSRQGSGTGSKHHKITQQPLAQSLNSEGARIKTTTLCGKWQFKKILSTSLVGYLLLEAFPASHTCGHGVDAILLRTWSIYGYRPFFLLPLLPLYLFCLFASIGYYNRIVVSLLEIHARGLAPDSWAHRAFLYTQPLVVGVILARAVPSTVVRNRRPSIAQSSKKWCLT